MKATLATNDFLTKDVNKGPPSPCAVFFFEEEEEERLSKSCPFIFLRKCNGLPKGFSFWTIKKIIL